MKNFLKIYTIYTLRSALNLCANLHALICLYGHNRETILAHFETEGVFGMEIYIK